MIPFLSFDYQDNLYREELINAMVDALDSKWYILGKRLEDFEQEYAAFNKVQYAVGVANGLDALIIALKILNVGEGDEVIVPSNTYIASWLAVSAVGAIPVPVEPDLISYNINADLIESAITPKTKAILPVHLYGQACRMDKIIALANKHNLFVVEDNAQAHGATLNGQYTGSFGHINATSFYPGKNLGALGDGGGITTNNTKYFEQAKVIRNYGSNKKYYNQIRGMNSRLDELQAAILSVKLKYIERLNDDRNRIAKIYNDELKSLTGIQLPQLYEGAKHVYHLYVILSENRDKLQQHLLNEGVQTMIHYPIPPHLQEAYKDLNYKKGDFPIAEELATTCLSLPMFPHMPDSLIEKVISAMRSFS